MGQHSDHHRRRFDSYRSRGSRRQNKIKGVTGKKKTREVAGPERLYHWHNEPDTVDVPIDLSYVRNVVEHEMARCSTTMMSKFLRERNLGVVRNWIIHNQSNVKVGTLKRFCKIFSIDPDNLEKIGVILNPIFPLDMGSKAFIKAKSHVLNEGRIQFGYKSVAMFNYNNQDPVLLWYFADIIRKAGGRVGQPRLDNYALEISGDLVLARALVASGLPFGRKTLRNPSLDPIIEKDPKLLKYHIQATLSEEGWFSLKIDRGRAYFDIAWGRSVDITDKFTEGQIESLRQISMNIRKRKIPIGSIIDPDLDRNIRQRPPNIFRKELDLLSLTHEPKVTVEWISEKVKELFPSVEWGGDLERIRKMLGRKEKG